MSMFQEVMTRSRRPYARVAWAVLTFVGLLYFAQRRPVRVGDALEYWVTLEAWFHHRTPEIRPSDLDILGRSLEANHVLPAAAAQHITIIPTAGGKQFTLHFWMYSLTAVPAKLALWLVHGDQLAALQVTNFAFLAGLLYFLLFAYPADSRWRWQFAALAAVTPVVWYLPWAHTEVYTWAAVCLSLLLLRTRHHGWAALAASMGALQNPAVACLAALAAVMAIFDGKRGWALVPPALGAAATLLAPLFYLVEYGHPSLHQKFGYADPSLISLARVWSFVTDLNQGMLPYAPGAVVLGLASAVQAARRRNWRALSVMATALAMIAVCGSTPNWNCGNANVLRYVVWVIPLFVWVIVECPWPGRWGRRAVAVTILVHAVIVAAGSSRERYIEQNMLARNVLRYAPWLYWPDPEIFAERQLHREGNYRRQLPIGFSRSSGVVTKLLADPCSLDWLPLRFRVDPAYAERVRQAPHGADLFYLDPPAGTVRRRPPTLPDQVTTTFWSACTRGEVPYVRDPGFVRALDGAIDGSALIFEWPGRADDQRQRELTAREPRELVETLALAGFKGITVDRSSTPDRGAAMMAELGRVLPDTAPILSESNHWAFFDLARASADLKKRLGPARWAAASNEVSNPLAVTWGPGFYDLETDRQSGRPFRWAQKEATLTIENGLDHEQSAVLQARFATLGAAPARLEIAGDLLAETLAISGDSLSYVRSLRVAPGAHVLRFSSDGKAVTPPKDPRSLVFRIESFGLDAPPP
jgi:hypothetical protein